MKKQLIFCLLALLCFTGMSFEGKEKPQTIAPYSVITGITTIDHYYKDAEIKFSGCGPCAWQTCGEGGYRYQQFCYNELIVMFWCSPCGGGW